MRRKEIEIFFLGINMYTYLKFGLPRVMPFGMEEVRLKLSSLVSKILHE